MRKQVDEHHDDVDTTWKLFLKGLEKVFRKAYEQLLNTEEEGGQVMDPDEQKRMKAQLANEYSKVQRRLRRC